MHVHVYETGRDDRVRRVEDVVAAGGQVRAELDDEAVAQTQVAARVESGGRVDDPAVFDQQGVTGR
jgi:hypothetical protein